MLPTLQPLRSVHMSSHSIEQPVSSLTPNHTKRRAPEKLEADEDSKYRFGFSFDVWSMGITLWQLAFTDMCGPYGSGKSIANMIRQVCVSSIVCRKVFHMGITLLLLVSTKDLERLWGQRAKHWQGEQPRSLRCCRVTCGALSSVFLRHPGLLICLGNPCELHLRAMIFCWSVFACKSSHVAPIPLSDNSSHHCHCICACVP